LRDAPPGGIICISDALVAQPDRASDYESEGRRFESCRARPANSCICRSFCSNSAFGSANLSGSDRNVTGVEPRLGRSKPRKAALRGSPQPALRSHSGNPAQRAQRGKTEGRAGPPGHQPGQGAGDRDPREDRAGRVGARQRQGGHGREGGGGLPEDKRMGVQEDGTGVTPTCRYRAAVHLPAERTLDMALGTAKTTRGLKRFVKKGGPSPHDTVWSGVGSLSTGTKAPQ
jgi:hypothetical protein